MRGVVLVVALALATVVSEATREGELQNRRESSVPSSLKENATLTEVTRKEEKNSEVSAGNPEGQSAKPTSSLPKQDEESKETPSPFPEEQKEIAFSKSPYPSPRQEEDLPAKPMPPIPEAGEEYVEHPSLSSMLKEKVSVKTPPSITKFKEESPVTPPSFPKQEKESDELPIPSLKHENESKEHQSLLGEQEIESEEQPQQQKEDENPSFSVPKQDEEFRDPPIPSPQPQLSTTSKYLHLKQKVVAASLSRNSENEIITLSSTSEREPVDMSSSPEKESESSSDPSDAREKFLFGSFSTTTYTNVIASTSTVFFSCISGTTTGTVCQGRAGRRSKRLRSQIEVEATDSNIEVDSSNDSALSSVKSPKTDDKSEKLAFTIWTTSRRTTTVTVYFTNTSTTIRLSYYCMAGGISYPTFNCNTS